MTKQLLLIFILMFSFTSCDLKEILGEKKDDKKDNPAAPSGDDPEGGNQVAQGDPNSCLLKFYMGSDSTMDMMRKYTFCVYIENQEISQNDCDSIANNIESANVLMEVSGGVKSVTVTSQNECANDIDWGQVETGYQSICTYGSGLKIYSYAGDGVDSNTSDANSQELCESGGSGDFTSGAPGTFDSTNYTP